MVLHGLDSALPLTLSSIRIFARPSAKAVKQLEDKVRLLGRGEVTVHPQTHECEAALHGSLAMTGLTAESMRTMASVRAERDIYARLLVFSCQDL